jgi:spore coat polysaccharide biosynthesis protein SpsF
MIAIIIQARMGSTRLPGKVLKPVAGRPMFSYQIERLRRVKRTAQIIVATTTREADQPIVDFCAAEGVECTRGSENDVLSRYFEAASAFGADHIVRVTSDCPLLDPELVDLCLDTMLDAGPFDYVSNMIEPSWPYGMAVEVVTAAALAEANAEARDVAEREHVTPFIYWHPQRYRIKSVTMRPDLSWHRWTVDTPEDFELVSRVLQTLYLRNPRFTMHDVLALLEENPAWLAINRHIQQKAVVPTSEAG